MQSAAPPGGIVVSEETRRLVEGYFELRALGPTDVRGISEPINVYEVIATGALHGHFDLAARRGLTKFVGRERSSWNRCVMRLSRRWVVMGRSSR